MRGRPAFKATAAQRDRVKNLKADGWTNDRIARVLGISRPTLEKVFAHEIEFGLDEKMAEILQFAHKAAKRGNPAMVKWLADRRDAAKAASQVAAREDQPEAETTRVPAKGKKELAQQSAEDVTGKFAPPPPPKALH